MKFCRNRFFINFFFNIQVIREGFCKDEAVCIGTEVNLNPRAIEEIIELCAYAALDGVSLVAIDVNSNEVVAVAFNKIQVIYICICFIII